MIWSAVGERELNYDSKDTFSWENMKKISVIELGGWGSHRFGKEIKSMTLVKLNLRSNIIFTISLDGSLLGYHLYPY